MSDPLIDFLVRKSPHYRAFRDYYHAPDLVTHWRNYAAREDRFNRYAEMTSHGPSHLDGVAGLVTQFCLPFRAGGALNSSEMFVLYALARLHDVGMYTTFDPHFDQPFRIRDIHGYLSRGTLLRESAALFPGVADRAAIQIIALLCSYHQGKAALSDAELHRTPKPVRLPAAHALHGVEDTSGGEFVQWSLERELKFADAHGVDLFHLAGTGEEICPFLLGALIKLLDGCDFQSARIGSIEAVFRHADRNRSHLARTNAILAHAVPGSASAKRASVEHGFFAASIFHFLRNLMIERTLILPAAPSVLQIVIKTAGREDVRAQADALIESMAAPECGTPSETQLRFENVRDLVAAYIENPVRVMCRELGCNPDDPRLHEWAADDHYLIARSYIHREYTAVRHALQGPRGKDWPYCRVCPREAVCSLKNREWPSLEGPDGLCNTAAYEHRTHSQVLAAQPHLSYKLPFVKMDGHVARLPEENACMDLLGKGKPVLIFGPHGRGKSGLLEGIARRAQSAVPSVFHFRFDRHDPDQVANLITGFARFLAARGDFLLGNIIQDEVIGSRHETALLRTLSGGRAGHRNEPLLLCLDDFNNVAQSGEEFFKQLVLTFHQISGPDTPSRVLMASTKRPGDRYLKSGPFDVACYHLPPLSDAEASTVLNRGSKDEELIREAALVWKAYGNEPFAIPVWRRYSSSGLPRTRILRLFEDEIVESLVDAYRGRLGSETELAILLRVADGKALAAEDRESAAFANVVDRGLLTVDGERVNLTCPSWTDGHRRSRWLDRLDTARLLQDVAACASK